MPSAFWSPKSCLKVFNKWQRQSGDSSSCFRGQELKPQTRLRADVAPQSPHSPALLCFSPLFLNQRLPGLRAGASMAALEEFATFLVPVEHLWQVVSRRGLSSTAPLAGHLLSCTVAQAYGLRPPSWTRWKPRRPPEVMRSFRAGEWQKSRAMLQESEFHPGCRMGSRRWSRSCCFQG